MIKDEDIYRLIEGLRHPTGNGTVSYDSDSEGVPGFVIAQAVHALKPHSWTDEGTENCIGCEYRFKQEPLEEAKRIEKWKLWRAERGLPT